MRHLKYKLFVKRNKLHRNEEESECEEDRDSGNHDILLGVLSGEESDDNVCDSAYCNTVGDRVSKGHHDKSEESGNCISHIAHIDFCKVFEH